VGGARGRGHGGVSKTGRNLFVGCCIARSTSSTAGVIKSLRDIMLLWVTMGMHFCHNGGFVSFGWGLVG